MPKPGRARGRLLGSGVRDEVLGAIDDYEDSALRSLVEATGTEPLVIKFVPSEWTSHYATDKRLKISETPALTWGTGSYVTPLIFPLSSALYGRAGLVAPFDPRGWRVFDATKPSSRRAYMNWVRAQANFDDLVLTVHSTFANHELRNKFRRDFGIDCVLFHPDQEAELHTDTSNHVWMLVTDWTLDGEIDATMSQRFDAARFTVLIDEEFDLLDGGLPARLSHRKIESTTSAINPHACISISEARVRTDLASEIADHYSSGGYVHIYVEP